MTRASQPAKPAVVAAEIAVALFGSFLTMGLGLLARVLLDPSTRTAYHADKSKLLEFLTFQFELWGIAVCLLLGAAAVDHSKKEKLFWPALGMISAGFLLLIFAVATFIFDFGTVLKIIFPDLVGIVLIFYAIRTILHN